MPRMSSQSFAATLMRVDAEAMSLRAAFHAEPDPPGEESRTVARIVRQLKAYGVPIGQLHSGVGVVVTFPGRAAGPTLTIRTAIDGLPIQERTDAPYASRQPGIMHACGHDVGIAVLLALGKLVQAQPPKGTLRLVFQPAEETLRGAKQMLKTGALHLVPTDFICGFHLTPKLPIGTVGYTPGIIMAGVDDFDVTVQGSGGHVGAPDASADALLTACQIVSSVRQVLAQHAGPGQAALHVGRIQGGTARNVVAQRTTLEGTLRYLSQADASELWAGLESRILEVARTQRTQATLRRNRVIPMLRCGPVGEGLLQRALRRLSPSPELRPVQASMAADDAALFYERAPGLYWLVGCGVDGHLGTPPLHSDRFDAPDDALRVALAVAASVTHEFFHWRRQVHGIQTK
jgi:amidohydrolase